MKIIKRDCSEVDFNKDKIYEAIMKAMTFGSGSIKPDIAHEVADEIETEASIIADLDVYKVETMVFEKLCTKGETLTAKAYEGYRSIREFQREVRNSTDDTVIELLCGESEYWNEENSNKNAVLVTTQRDYMAGISSEDISKRFLLTPDIVQAHNEGILHFHDIDYFAQKTLYNCCLINLEDMLQNGTVISGTMIEKPHSFSTACNIATQVIAQVASSQYGGQTISLAHLAPFVEVSRQKIRKQVVKELENVNVTTETINEIVENRVREEIKKGVQTIQYQVLTLMTTNGQAPFLSVFMYLNEVKDEKTKNDLALIIEEVLKQRIQGVKNEDGIWITPAFPKLLYVLENDNTYKGSKYYYLTELAAECTAKRMVPDYISEKIMLRDKIDKNGNGNVYGCMGCVDGKEIVTYKFDNRLYVESFERMWNRLSDYFEVKHQYTENNPNVYMNLSNVEIYDTVKGFVDTKRIIRNVSNNWVDVHLSNGRRLLCTTDHPFEILNKGQTQAKDLSVSDKITINSNQYSEESVSFDSDKAWLLGFLLCDGCYQSNHISASIAAVGEDEIEKKFNSTFLKYFGLKTKTILQEREKRGTYKDLVVISDKNGGLQYVINYLTIKFGGINKVNRHIPNEVFSWNHEAKTAFLAGMIDADGYLNDSTYNVSVVQIGSTNKELALQQMALAQALGMPARVYHNHYNKKNPNAIRYRVEFLATKELLNFLVCKKKREHYKETTSSYRNTYAEVVEVLPVKEQMYSYDVTTDSEHFEVSGLYSHNCRSFLTPYIDEKGNPKYYGRMNQGVVTINLPDIALSSDGNFDTFWQLFETRTELCHKALQIRHQRLEGTISDVAPVLWQHGAIARLKKGEKIDKLLHNGYSTISLGYAGLYECVKYMTGNSHTDGGVGEEFGLKVMQALNDKCNQWKEAEHIDYSLYGSPIESTTYKFAKCLKNRFGTVEGITDKNYITNSYHVPVFEEINAFDKLTLESKFQKLSPGGAISYVEVPNLTNNIPVVLQIIQFIYENIMYAELNTKSDYCSVCGYDKEIEIVTDKETGHLYWRCPRCGNTDKNKMSITRRTCGYLGQNYWNQGRTQEIKERVLHIDDKDLEE